MQSLNILYLVQQAYQFSVGTTSPHFAGAQGVLLQIIQYLEWTAIFFATAFLIGFIYLRLKFEVIEHSLHRKRHEAELEFSGQAHAQRRNPRWDRVMELANSQHDSDWRRAILEADIMLGEILDERGYIGENIGEKLKSVNRNQLPSVDAAWEAHRLRNVVAHMGEGFDLTHRDTLAAIDSYRRAFEEFEYI